jgi:hypothetical protein
VAEPPPGIPFHSEASVFPVVDRAGAAPLSRPPLFQVRNTHRVVSGDFARSERNGRFRHLPGLRSAFTTLHESVNCISLIANAGTDLYEVGWLPEKASAADCRYGNIEEFRYLVFIQERVVVITLDCHS